MALSVPYIRPLTKKELYQGISEKAANLLYLVIKNHPFVDGNKRIGSLLFIYFLEKNHYN
ncbi:hypothetical protein AUJ66_05315 [Candidatus Desantisbacteria bacterium CG1_02_38_46]|uniref:Fido domain-containing protein n=3 Tax=unclassified Candidatus Desantisiibacteriota TaxID=3106372 RepID=A0A2H9PEB7_9BACT|nr:MAG: hypothetical protein AUJ66_05315 [Candidatus Desantisbacteria bacterium CG1_02_38_46]PIU51761.1 MAG: hypothetical protein COS91_02765 [Candidatus Desantisbacteria bacterium CG07_land_8_20_14_0_80_39_15]PIZ17341.1 MAG: hypothetical protein COY51_00460 [Candidatus Desantisbacteria bacterium CG_4_10_14_0_8_um_filter_39_17]